MKDKNGIEIKCENCAYCDVDYLLCPAVGEEEPITHKNYVPLKKWELEKLLQELKESEASNG